MATWKEYKVRFWCVVGLHLYHPVLNFPHIVWPCSTHCISVCLTLFLVLAHGLTSIERPMASKSKSKPRAQKKPAAKGLARKELEVAQKVLPVAGFARATRPQEGITRQTPKSTQPAPKA